MSRSADRWPGHPWAPDDGRHDPHGITRTWCSGCNEWCSPRVGCGCCTTLVVGWLMEEARWWAEVAADELASWSHTEGLFTGGIPGRLVLPLPWRQEVAGE